MTGFVLLIISNPLPFELTIASTLSYLLIDYIKCVRTEKLLQKTSFATSSLGNKTSGFSGDEENDKLSVMFSLSFPKCR